jgi:hypothetical protein
MTDWILQFFAKPDLLAYWQRKVFKVYAAAMFKKKNKFIHIYKLFPNQISPVQLQ